ncbi:MAG: hypothetical protein J5858_03310 [Lentisphaeria bacterium]|nr:hypothetical protein [Lentisphaeria bacterium]
MRKLMTFTTAALLLVLPELKGQGPENAMETAASQETTADDSGKGTKKDPPKTTQFSGQQKKIKSIMDRIEKAKRMSEKRKLEDYLKREQNVLKLMLGRKVQPLKNKINPLKEKIRLSSPSLKRKVEEELAAVEEQIKTLETEADLETWCKESDSKSELSDASNPGSGKKGRKYRKKK